ncbi:methyltransferase [Neisseria leonii]|uniref:methyltransferase n=1 Tax=Neisseria leonii TaxID=2995413 RepID=UPI00237B3B3D|nr:methyltransferase [Neisseria sp. 3986]MDD9325739.1 methyltransferase [Neisseria sp. 3986]
MMQQDKWTIHRYLAEQADARLDWLKREPEQIFLAGADGDCSRRLLAARYPHARFSEFDARADYLAEAAASRQGGWLARLGGRRKTVQYCQAADTPLPAAGADMLWSNLGLITAREAVPVFGCWADALKTDGLLFFTHFGADSLSGLRTFWAEHGIRTDAPLLRDMHDLGDMLFHNGFYDPVMDTARLVLDYRDAGVMYRDMQAVGLWQALNLSDGQAALDLLRPRFSDGLSITLETVFGHALKRPQLAEGEQAVQFVRQ